MLLLGLIMSTVTGWRPESRSGAVVPSGTMDRPWAKYSGTLPSTDLNCSGDLADGYGFVGTIKVGNTVWESIYTPMQNHGDDVYYIVVNGEGRVYMCDEDPINGDSADTVIAGATDIYWRCNSGTTYSPTPPPTPPPTATPTSASSLSDSEFEQLYGPADVYDGSCTGSKGAVWYDPDGDGIDELDKADNNTLVRYCCGHSMCTGMYYHVDYSTDVHHCACYPAPWEVQVRGNGGPCWACPTQPFPEMVYCDDTPHCNREYDGALCGAPDFQDNACPSYFPSSPAAPTPWPTPRLESPGCWVYDDAGACTSGGTWCDAEWTDLDYIIHPRSGMESQRASTVDDYNALGSGDQLVMDNIVIGGIGNAMQDDTTCWCTNQNLEWLPFGMVQAVETSSEIDFKAAAETVPFPRSYLRGIQAPGTMYLQSLTAKISAFGFVETTPNETVFNQPDLPVQEVEYLAPLGHQCNELVGSGCVSLDYIQPFVAPTEETCRFVCVDIYYAESVLWGPLSVTWRQDVKTLAECTGESTWVNARILKPLLLQEHWQTYANTIDRDYVVQSVPWINFTKGDTSWPDDTNCKLTATTYCGIKGTGYDSYAAWWCGNNNDGLESQDPDVYTLYHLVNFGGAADRSPAMNTISCSDPPTDPIALHRVIPNITFPGAIPTTIAEPWRQGVRTQLSGLVWKVFMGFGQGACEGSQQYDIAYADNATFPVEVQLEWVDVTTQTGCIGMPGCGDFPVEGCSNQGVPNGALDIPGCIYRGGTTVATTTATIGTVTNFGTFAPSNPGPPTAHVGVGFDRADHDAAYAASGVAALLVFTLVLVGILCRGTRDEDDDEEHEPFMAMG